MQERSSGKRTDARSNDAKEFDSPRLRDVSTDKILAGIWILKSRQLSEVIVHF
jgi:hypothetical protein